ncbi:SLC13 family permease [Desulfolithobacter sp.]
MFPLPNRERISAYITGEWLLLTSMAGLLGTSIGRKGLPAFSRSDLEIIYILAVLLVAVRGLETSGLIDYLALRLEKGRYIALKLTGGAFFLSMVVTNDVALVVLVPLTLSLRTDRKDILVILQVLAVNAGSALTPFGNPQNLFLYWHYRIDPAGFVATIAPFSAIFFLLIMLAAFFVRVSGSTRGRDGDIPISGQGVVHAVLLLIVILSVLRILPLQATGAVAMYALSCNREALKIDYGLLLTFFCFFGLAENLQQLSAATLEHTSHVFLGTALASQLISNVPATLLFAKFTPHWQALLWGSSVGGFGSLVGSLANLIAWRLYTNHGSTGQPFRFTLQFLGLGYLAFFLGLGLYFCLEFTV